MNNNNNETSKVENNIINNELPDAQKENNATETNEKVSYTNDYYAKVTGKSIYVNFKPGRRNDTESSFIIFHNTGTDITVLRMMKRKILVFL